MVVCGSFFRSPCTFQRLATVTSPRDTNESHAGAPGGAAIAGAVSNVHAFARVQMVQISAHLPQAVRLGLGGGHIVGAANGLKARVPIRTVRLAASAAVGTAILSEHGVGVSHGGIGQGAQRHFGSNGAQQFVHTRIKSRRFGRHEVDVQVVKFSTQSLTDSVEFVVIVVVVIVVVVVSILWQQSRMTGQPIGRGVPRVVVIGCQINRGNLVVLKHDVGGIKPQLRRIRQRSIDIKNNGSEEWWWWW
mmetsp:Transcript_13661/g.37766  ORF Transcript_13661/g.37766 Transcript_13661/m.37766 type:complete len:247 (-) Transcript_13661:270-1010(-)